MQVLWPHDVRATFLREYVVDAQAHIAVQGERGADILFAHGVLDAARPAAAVDDDHAGMFPAVFLGEVEVRLFLPVRAEVVDVFLHADVRGLGDGKATSRGWFYEGLFLSIGWTVSLRRKDGLSTGAKEKQRERMVKFHAARIWGTRETSDENLCA
jgi:hypothetical protein